MIDIFPVLLLPGLTIFGSLLLLLLILVESAPPTAAAVPWLGKAYVCVCMGGGICG